MNKEQKKGFILITGGSGKIASEVIGTLVQEGYSILLLYRKNRIQAKKMVQKGTELGGTVLLFKLNLLSFFAPSQLKKIILRYQPVHWINFASIFPRGSLLNTPSRIHLKLFKLHTLVPITLAQSLNRYSNCESMVLALDKGTMTRFSANNGSKQHNSYFLSRKGGDGLVPLLSQELSGKTRVNGIYAEFLIPSKEETALFSQKKRESIELYCSKIVQLLSDVSKNGVFESV